jgi:NTE family protein
VVGILVGAEDPLAARALVGQLVVAQERVPPEVRRAVIDARLPTKEWPDREVRLTVVDATTGVLTVFDARSGVDLVVR